MNFQVGQDVTVSRDGRIEAIDTVDKVTHGGKRVHVGRTVFDGRGREKTDGWHPRWIAPTTDEHRRSFTDACVRNALWKAIDDGIAANGFERRSGARAKVSTDTLRQVVDLLRGDKQ